MLKLIFIGSTAPGHKYFGSLLKMLTLLSVILIITSCTQTRKQSKESRLHGMYKLYISENQDENGNWHEDPWTKGGTGFIVYDGLGHMAVQITPTGYTDFKWLSESESIIAEKTYSMTEDELKEAVKEFASSYVYIANYTIEDTTDIVRHHRISSSIPDIWGTTVRRSFMFSGDTLVLQILNGNRRLKWIKQP